MGNLLAGLGSLAAMAQNIELLMSLSVISIILIIAILVIVIIMLVKVGSLKGSNTKQSTIERNTLNIEQKPSNVLAKTRHNRRIVVK